MKGLVYSGDWEHAKRGVMWGGDQMLDEWFQGEFVFERSGVRVFGGSVKRGRFGVGYLEEGYGERAFF